MRWWIGMAITAVAVAPSGVVRATQLTAAAASVNGTYYENSDHSRRHDESIDAVVPLADFALTFEAASRSGADPRGHASTQEALFGVNARSAAVGDIQARAGVVRFEAGGAPAGSLAIRYPFDAGEVRTRVEYTPLFETADMVRNEIMFAGIELGGRARLHPRFNPNSQIFLRQYSDNNGSIKVRGNLPFAVLLDPIRVELGYRQEYAAFRRQSHGGYFDPDELHSFQGFGSVSYWEETLHGYAEIFGGGQTSRRGGIQSRDQFAGFYVEGGVTIGASFRFALVAEGDDYALGSASGFRHVQTTLRLSKLL